MMEQNFTQSDADPCYYYKVYEDGSRIDICMYVDDGWSEDDAGPYADADLELLNARFNMEYKPDPRHFLGMNTTVHSEAEGDRLDVEPVRGIRGARRSSAWGVLAGRR